MQIKALLLAVLLSFVDPARQSPMILWDPNDERFQQHGCNGIAFFEMRVLPDTEIRLRCPSQGVRSRIEDPHGFPHADYDKNAKASPTRLSMFLVDRVGFESCRAKNEHRQLHECADSEASLQDYSAVLSERGCSGPRCIAVSRGLTYYVIASGHVCPRCRRVVGTDRNSSSTEGGGDDYCTTHNLRLAIRICETEENCSSMEECCGVSCTRGMVPHTPSRPHLDSPTTFPPDLSSEPVPPSFVSLISSGSHYQLVDRSNSTPASDILQVTSSMILLESYYDRDDSSLSVLKRNLEFQVSTHTPGIVSSVNLTSISNGVSKRVEHTLSDENVISNSISNSSINQDNDIVELFSWERKDDPFQLLPDDQDLGHEDISEFDGEENVIMQDHSDQNSLNLDTTSKTTIGWKSGFYILLVLQLVTLASALLLLRKYTAMKRASRKISPNSNGSLILSYSNTVCQENLIAANVPLSA